MEIFLKINGIDLSEKVTSTMFLDRRNQYEYIINLDDYYILNPIPKNQTISLNLNQEVIYEENIDVDYEIQTKDTGTTIRIRVNK